MRGAEMGEKSVSAVLALTLFWEGYTEGHATFRLNGR